MPMSAHEVRRALHELGDLRYAAGDLDDALRRIVRCTHDLFAVDGAGLMLIDPDQLLRSVADSDKRVGDLEELQIEHGEGPCIDAFDDKELVHAADLAALTIANTMQSEQRGELATQLQRALDARVVIEQAKGAMVARDGVTPGAAFERMRRRARAERRRVLEIAEEVMRSAGRS